MFYIFQTIFNASAPPFVSKASTSQAVPVDISEDSKIFVGMTNVPVNAKIWSSIASDRDPGIVPKSFLCQNDYVWKPRDFQINPEITVSFFIFYHNK